MEVESLLVIKDNNIVDLNQNITLITKEIEELHNKIEHYLNEEKCININKLSEDCLTLSDKSSNIAEEIATFEIQIKNEAIRDISNTTIELQKIISDVEDIDFSLCVIEQLVECDKQLKQFHELKGKNDLDGAVLALSSVTDLLNNPVNGLEKLELFKKIKVELVIYWEELLLNLSELWGHVLNWSESTENDKKTVIINIDKTDISKRDELLQALYSSKQIHMEMKNFASFLQNHVFNPLIHLNAEIDILHENIEQIKINISLNKKYKPGYEDVLNNLKIVFEYLYINLDYNKDSSNSLIRMISEQICNDFSDILIKDCLVDTIPNCISELQDYGKVTSQVEAFQKYLSSINFFESENFSILHYANNIDVLFANKTSQYFLENARSIVKKDLSNIMSVGCEIQSIADENNAANLDKVNDETLQYFFQSFCLSPFRFPRCAISRSVQELLDLVILMMEQAIEASDMCARRLYYTARNVFELYIAIVPLHHKKLIETMPQQVALFHNNCMYLAHHLLMLGPKWQKNLAGRELNYMIIFCDQIKELRDLATHTLLTHMLIQKKQLLDTIRSSDLYYIATKDTLSENAEQAIRQCIRQLQVLKTVWSGIFPSDVYRRLITCLANVFVEELISKVVVQEDITADVATQLTDLFKIVLNRLPQIYHEDSVIHKNISSWMKFNELILVLGGNLATIEERWFNGAGPLALQFKPEEIKRLIRALFQNTTFRANLLSKIK